MNSHENVEQLLRRFMDSSEAGQAACDLKEGDRLFGLYPAPAVSPKAIDAVQRRVRGHLRKHYQIRQFAATGSAAAVLAVIVLTGIYSLYIKDLQIRPQTNTFSHKTVDIWNDLAFQDASMIESELTDVAAMLDSIRSDGFDFIGSHSIDLMELEEIEIIASNTDFWKG